MIVTSHGTALAFKRRSSRVSSEDFTKYLDEFNKLERQAREKNLGLWNACTK